LVWNFQEFEPISENQKAKARAFYSNFYKNKK